MIFLFCKDTVFFIYKEFFFRGRIFFLNDNPHIYEDM